MDWSRIGSRELSCRNILVHEITMIVKSISRSSLLSLDGGRGRQVLCRNSPSHIGIDIVHDIVCDIEDAPKRPSLYTRYWYDIEVFIRYRVRYRMVISGYTDIKGKTFDVVQNIGAISEYADNKVFPSISKIWSILGTICQTWGGRAHRPRSSPADRSSLLVLDPLGRSVLLRDCLDALSCWSSVKQLLSVAAVARPWCGLPAGHGGQS
jgi:hypothetical protein